jgi:hypothetical protein
MSSDIFFTTSDSDLSYDCPPRERREFTNNFVPGSFLFSTVNSLVS